MSKNSVLERVEQGSQSRERAQPFAVSGVRSGFKEPAEPAASLDKSGFLDIRGGSKIPEMGGSKTPLVKRARRKAIGHPLAKALMEVASGNLMGNAYRRTFYQCGSVLDQTPDGKVRQWYCSSRWCPVCSSIKTARAIDAYGDEVKSWGDDAVFVTLTIPSVKAHRLRGAVQLMHKTFRNIVRVIQQQGLEVKAIRTTECTFSSVRHDKGLPAMHPHCHIVCSSREVGERLISGWLKRFPDAKRSAQDIRKADSGSVSELFKYSCKLIADYRCPDGSRGVVPPVHLDAIFTAFRRLRLWQVYGITSATGRVVSDEDEVAPDKGTAVVKRIGERVEWVWRQSARDWIDQNTGEVLTGYIPSTHFDGFIQKIERMV